MRDTLKDALRPAQHQAFQPAEIPTTNVNLVVVLLTIAMEPHLRVSQEDPQGESQGEPQGEPQGESRVPWSTGFFLLPPSLPALCICSAVNQEAALRAKNPSGYHDQN